MDYEGQSKLFGKGLMNVCVHRLSPIYGDNMLSLDRAALVAGIIEVYEIDVAKLIVREIHNR